MPTVDALLAAGSVPGPRDPLYALTRGQPKARLEIAGQPMIEWVLAALHAAQTVRNVVIIGAESKGLGVRDYHLPSHGSIVDNLIAGAALCEQLPEPPSHLLLISSDIPLVTAEMIDWNVRAALEKGGEACYHILAREAMERRFPNSRRTYFRLREGQFCGADLHVLNRSVFSGYNPVWRNIIDARKNALKMAQLVGVDALLWLMSGRAPIALGERLIRERLGLDGHLLVAPQAEIAMDVDKPHQVTLVEHELSQRIKRI
ncbi:MAG: NTP transferase domain-containing protein [Anaerolineales bacterium]|nr:NTP transferase domain-containing protein [Anaerolineales bacterium]